MSLFQIPGLLHLNKLAKNANCLLSLKLVVMVTDKVEVNNFCGTFRGFYIIHVAHVWFLFLYLDSVVIRQK